MNLDNNENYGQDGQYFQDDYKDDDSVSNVLDNSINDEEQDLYSNQEDDLDEGYKDADDIDPDDLEEDDFDEDLDEDYTNQDDDMDADEEIGLDDENVDQDRNI